MHVSGWRRSLIVSLAPGLHESEPRKGERLEPRSKSATGDVVRWGLGRQRIEASVHKTIGLLTALGT